MIRPKIKQVYKNKFLEAIRKYPDTTLNMAFNPHKHTLNCLFKCMSYFVVLCHRSLYKIMLITEPQNSHMQLHKKMFMDAL